MKTLVLESVVFLGTRKGPQAKTIFNSDNKNLIKYYDISELSGKTAVVEFEYEQGDICGRQVLSLSIPADLTEEAVKHFIITSIKNIL